MRILIIEDDEAARTALRRGLETAGYEVVVAANGEVGVAQVQTVVPDAVVLDLELSGIDGMEVCRQLRRGGSRVPILMLSGRDAIDDLVAGFDAGADDYLVKPYDMRELEARLHAIIRRHVADADARALRFGDLTLDADAHAAHVGDRTIELTRTEYLLLELFMLNPRRVLPNAVISDRVWGYDDVLSGKSLRVYIGYLRRKLEACGAPRLIQTVHGIGYVLREADPSAGKPEPEPEPEPEPDPERESEGGLSSPTDPPRRLARR